MNNFTCDRTCPIFEFVDRCRFNPLLTQFADVVVTSHTMKVAVEFRNLLALEKAATKIGAVSLGVGNHELYEDTAHGHGIRLDKWAYPLVVDIDSTGKITGELSFDNYNGQWGDIAQLDRLKGAYAVELARQTAQDEGWITEDNPDGSLLIHHNDGGTLTVSESGVVEANGFTGQGCHAPATQLSEALGSIASSTAKPAYYASQQELRVSE